jgi:D-alanyl-D-alanine carboxypeptidase (penicillin-binding protein 5/6)
MELRFLIKKIRLFSTVFLILAVLFSNQAIVQAEDSDSGAGEGGVATVLGGRAFLPPNELVSTSAYVFNMDTGFTVYAKNEHERIFPASTTKIMTALVVLENASLDDYVTFSEQMSVQFNTGNPNMHDYEIAKAGFTHSQQGITVRDALYGLMLPSGCDAANALAYTVGGGDIDAFIEMMNDKAEQIGCKDTNFGNAHGLFQPDNWSTAYDMFLITQYVYRNHGSVFAQIVGTTEYTVPITQFNPDGVLVNTNRLIRAVDGNPYYYDFALGVKTGGFDEYFTGNRIDGWIRHEGIANLVSLAERDGYTYIVITMNAPWFPFSQRSAGENGLHHAYTDHKNLYDWAFSTFENTLVMRTTDPITSVRVLEGDSDEVMLFAQMDSPFWTLLPRGLDVKNDINRVIERESVEIEAPVAEGTVLGTIELMLANQSLGRWDLIATESVARTQTAIARDRIQDVFSSWWIIPLLIILALLVIVLIVLSYIRKHRKKKQEKYGRKPPNRRIRR